MFNERIPFDGYPRDTRLFYAQVLYVMMLNIAAVKQGLFDVLLSETEDPFSWFRFYDQIPSIARSLGMEIPRE